MLTLPGEALAIAICELALEIVKGQPPEIKAQLWQRYLDETKWIHDLMVKWAPK